jgi:hypothetical protein
MLDTPDLLAPAQAHHFGTTMSPPRVEPPWPGVTMKLELGVRSHRRSVHFRSRSTRLS